MMRKAMKAFASHRIIFASVLALTIFGAVYGFAATLNVGTNTLSAGNQAVLSCQAGTVTGTYTPTYVATAPAGYKVQTIVLNGLDTTVAGCASKAISVTLTDSSNTSLGTFTGTVPTTGTSMSVAAGSTIAAGSVAGLNIAISG